MGNVLLLLCSTLLVCIALFYFKRKWPDLDIIDIYLIFIVFYFGAIPFLRGLYYWKGVVFDSENYNSWAIILVYLQLLLIILLIVAISWFLSKEIKNYLKLRLLIDQWAKVNNVVFFLILILIILFHFISYYKYGVKSHILPDDFAKIGKKLPYWFTSVRTIYGSLTLGMIIVLASKMSRAKERNRFLWWSLIIILLPFIAYFGRKGFVNAVVMTGLIWLITSDMRLFQFKTLTMGIVLVLSFFIASNLYLTYRSNFQSVGISLRQLENPITAALNFKATLINLVERAGTWEFNYLVFDKQMQKPGNVKDIHKITIENIKSATPRIFWPEKKFLIPSEVLAEAYNAELKDVSFGTNIFGIAQFDFGYYSVIIVPVIIILVMIIMSGLMKFTFNNPLFLWGLSIAFLNFVINVEENGPELFFLLRNIIVIMVFFLLYKFTIKLYNKLNTILERSSATSKK